MTVLAVIVKQRFMSPHLMVQMKAFTNRLVLLLSSLESLDHKYVPIYFIEFFPLLSVRNLDILKSFPFRSWYVTPFSSNIKLNSVCKLVSVYV